MWHPWLIRAVALLTGFFSYSGLVAAKRADARKDVIEREEFSSKVRSRGSTSEREPQVNDNSEKKFSR